MTAPLPDDELASVLARAPRGPGHRAVEQLRQEGHQHPDATLRLSAAFAGQLVAEVDGWKTAAVSLGQEVRSFRDNVRLERDAMPGKRQTCLNCLYFDAVKSFEGHIDPDRQAIVSEAGACTAAPPTPVTRPTATGVMVVSVFPPVHPNRWCGRWTRLESRKVPYE